MICVDKVECQRAIRFSAHIGDERPLYCTATGKVLLAFQAPDFAANYFKVTPLLSVGPCTISDKSNLEQELVQIRITGFAEALEEQGEGIGAFASPVFDGTGSVIASVSLCAPSYRARALREEYVREVRATAVKMSLLLGWKAGLHEGEWQ